jgi:class 3 adenylate cyclase
MLGGKNLEGEAMGAVYNYVPPAPMTRAERWAKEDTDRRLRQAVANPDVPDAMTEAVVGYFAWKAGEALGEAVSAYPSDTDSSD